MKLKSLKHKLTTTGKATVDTISFRVNADTEKFINKEKRAGRLTSTPSELIDNHLDLVVTEPTSSE